MSTWLRVVAEAGHTKPRRVPVRNLAVRLCLGGKSLLLAAHVDKISFD
jgi:hypothetical protein